MRQQSSKIAPPPPMNMILSIIGSSSSPAPEAAFTSPWSAGVVVELISGFVDAGFMDFVGGGDG